jgi:hypothetical protein
MANCAYIMPELGREHLRVREVGLPAATEHSLGKGEVWASFLSAARRAQIAGGAA